MKQFKFKYPDIPFIEDRVLYDYLFTMDRLVREQGTAINEIIEVLNDIIKSKQSII